MNLPHDDVKLPAGLWYEASRNCYRVRVRRRNRIVHQTRHPATKAGLDAAFASLRQGRRHRCYITSQEDQIGTTEADTVKALADGII